MLLIKTIVKKSNIHGQGLFADENIKKGQAMWKFNNILDKKIGKKEFAKLPALVKRFVKYYSGKQPC